MRYIFLLLSFQALGQDYTAYFTGDTTNVDTMGAGGICLMGGASEHDEAMRWFLRRANGGDVLVLRASGADGYNNYMYTDLAINVNSVETIVFNNANAANDAYVQQRVTQAEAIWFAGGDQWNYVSYWRGTAIDSLINLSLQQRNIVIGGTSAGMAIQGGFYFSAQNGTVSSATALSNPYDAAVTVDSTDFIRNAFMEDVITDTHFDNPDRKGRLMTFMARIVTDYQVSAKAIACDEYTAVCIDENGLAKVFGDYPNYDETAYFLQINCTLADASPETCMAGSPLQWNLGGEAVKAYEVKGTPTGANTFDLSDWRTGVGGDWMNWTVDNNSVFRSVSDTLHCGATAVEVLPAEHSLLLYPNPCSNILHIEFSGFQQMRLFSPNGALLLQSSLPEMDLSSLPKGMYFVEVLGQFGKQRAKVVRE